MIKDFVFGGTTNVDDLTEDILDVIPEGASYGALLETFSGLLAAFIKASSRNEREMGAVLHTVQNDIAEKLFGRIN